MSIDFKNKRELTFLGIGILMLIIVISAVILSMQFLMTSTNQALEKYSDTSGSVLKFQIEKAQSLKK